MTSPRRCDRLALKRLAAAAAATSSEESETPPSTSKDKKPRKSHAEVLKGYRERLKANAARYEAFKRSNRERCKVYRMNLSEEKRIVAREKARLRVQKSRRKKKEQQLTEQRQPGNKVLTLFDAVALEIQREKWREQKRRHRQTQDPLQRAVYNTRRRIKYRIKKETRGGQQRLHDILMNAADPHALGLVKKEMIVSVADPEGLMKNEVLVNITNPDGLIKKEVVVNVADPEGLIKEEMNVTVADPNGGLVKDAVNVNGMDPVAKARGRDSAVKAKRPAVSASRPAVSNPQSLLNSPHSSVNVTHSLLNSPHSSVNVPHSLLNSPHSSVNIPHPSLNAQHPALLLGSDRVNISHAVDVDLEKNSLLNVSRPLGVVKDEAVLSEADADDPATLCGVTFDPPCGQAGEKNQLPLQAANTDMSETHLLKAASAHTADAVTTMLSQSAFSLIEAERKYREAVSMLMGLLDLHSASLGDEATETDVWDNVIRTRARVEGCEKHVKGLELFFASVKTLTESSAAVAFLAGSEFTNSSLKERLASAQSHVGSAREESRRAESQLQKTQARCMENIVQHRQRHKSPTAGGGNMFVAHVVGKSQRTGDDTVQNVS